MLDCPGVEGGSMPLAGRPGDETVWLDPRMLLYGAKTAGELRAPSSFLTRAELDGVGDATEPDALRARSS